MDKNMKKTTVILAFTAVFSCVSLASNGFKEGNKLYLNGKYQDALGQYQEFLQKNPGQYEGYFNAGNAFFRQEQYESALNMYKKARELNKKDPDIQYNIDVTQKKLKEQQSQCDNPNQDKNGQNKQDGKQSQNSKGKSQKGDQKQQQGQSGQQAGNSKQETGNKKAGQQANNQPSTINNQPPSGMTADEVQALLNQKQNQEKRLQGYFGKQYQKQGQEPDMFNMSPMEMMMYMQKKMMDPNYEPQQPNKGGGGDEKDW